jgi:energy-coupling factor transporter ATP-binding protein EcfA2
LLPGTWDLNSLGWFAFQELCATILTTKFNFPVQTFSATHDGGRDIAFNGVLNEGVNGYISGSFSIQCKFSSRENNLTPTLMKEDAIKAEYLAKKGLADNYLIFTNMNISGESASKIESMFNTISRIKRCCIYGNEFIIRTIKETPELRSKIPRLYGLGDLSEILDDRAYSQAQTILSFMGNDIKKMVITQAYKNSYSALSKHHFVLLLGEPACGKSIIASCLAVAAVDSYGARPIKINDAKAFSQHFNPNEDKQFFWMDDVFGATQINSNRISEWNAVLPLLSAAINKGSQVIFTSRDYIYRDALSYLKVEAFPLIKNSQVVIKVSEIAEDEKEKILYNHIKFGDQDREYKTKIKQHLPLVAHNSSFLPETARRLGNKCFTSNLNLTEKDIKYFVENPKSFLEDIIRNIDANKKTAVALIFMRGGTLLSPVKCTTEEANSLKRLGGGLDELPLALDSLKDSILVNVFVDEQYIWRFKHPTMADAFASIVAENTELMDIYLTGAPLRQVLSEIVCSDIYISGAKLVIPKAAYNILLDRIDKEYSSSTVMLKSFLAYRSNAIFLSEFIDRFPEFRCELKIDGTSGRLTDLTIIHSLHLQGKLPESERLRHFNTLKKMATDLPDSTFSKKEARIILTDTEYCEILESIKNEVLPNINIVIDNMEDEFYSFIPPEDYFFEIQETLKDFRQLFSGDLKSIEYIDKAFQCIDDSIEYLQSKYEDPHDWGDHDLGDNVKKTTKYSIFDDVDE